MRAMTTIFAAASAIALTSVVSAEPAAEGKGRFTMSPVEGGLMRLDTETGAVALCTRKADAWACEAVKDGTGSDEKAKIEAENKSLKERIKKLEELANSLPPLDAPAPAEPPGGITKLPTEEEVDKALDYVERMFKKFRDRIQKFEQQPGGATPKPGGNSGAL